MLQKVPKKFIFLLLIACIPLLLLAAFLLTPNTQQATAFPEPASKNKAELGSGFLNPCKNEHPEWRKAQNIDGVAIRASKVCEPDNPYNIAAFVKGMNHISMRTLMNTRLSEDALIKEQDLDNDGDPDVIHIKLEVMELNGATPELPPLITTYDIAPGIQPGLWVFTPKSRGMSVKHHLSIQANDLLRAPSPVIRIEQGDKVYITLENSHYFPHTLHFHGVDHPFQTNSGGDNDGVPVTGEAAVFPGDNRTYELSPRHAGTMFYHCHVQTDKHLLMGLNGMFVVEENRPNNWLQTFNVGAGQVRYPSVAINESYDQEYDLHYQALDKNLTQTIQQHNDVRLIGQAMNRVYNMTESNQNYYLLNGHSFPYTLRDSLIITAPDQSIKLRIANAQHTQLALHFHGHKTTLTANDGVPVAKGLRITRDVFELAPAQRMDLELQTVNDGLHSYGPGIWLFHDHVETGITTDGISPGGNIALLVYEQYLDEKGLPTIREHAVNKVFNSNYYAKTLPVWGDGEFSALLGEANSIAPDYIRLIGFGLALGIAIGLIIFFAGMLKLKNR